MIFAKFLATAAAGLVLAAPAPKFSLTVGPSHLYMRDGQRTVIEVTDTGTKPMDVTASVVQVGTVTGKCVPARGAVTGVTVTPASFRLQPGRSGLATVTVAKNAPAADVAAMFTTATGKSGTARVSGAVGTQIVVGDRAGCHMAAPVIVTKDAASSGGIGAAIIALVFLLGLAGGIAYAVIWVRRRRRTRVPGRHATPTAGGGAHIPGQWE